MSSSHTESAPTGPPVIPPLGWVLHGGERPDAAPVRIWGLAPEERLLRALRRAGCRDATLVVPEALPVDTESSDTVLCRGDVILDERIVAALAEGSRVLVVDRTLGAVAARVGPECARDAVEVLLGRRPTKALSLPTRAPEEMAPAYLAKLRRWEPATAHAARAELVAEVERRTFAASYKGVTDLVTKWVWPAPAAIATRFCANRGITPNAVTIASWVLALAVIPLFAEGAFLIGLIAAWAMTFLDTVDGKLARVTLTSSRLGDVLDHGLDLLHPPFWYFAWGVGIGAASEPVTMIVVAGYVVGRLLEGVFLAAFELETHSWKPIDAMFRTITARRNPNLILLSVGAIGGRPDLGLLMVALWTLISLGFHTLRLLQAFVARRRGDAIVAWDLVENQRDPT
jgi:phosphatidylglycerophosphate synthase